MADGTLITLPKGTALNITFDESDLVVMSAKSTRSIGYSVSSMTDKVTVEVTSSADIKAKVIPADNSGKTGTLQVSTGSAIDEYSKVIVFVSNGDKVIMRSITFEEAGLVVEENATKIAPAEGGEVVLEFLTNVKCEASIPEEAQDWISVVPATRALKKEYITLRLEPNEGYYRSTTVTVQSPDGKLRVEYQVEQEGDLGVNINPDEVPDNEIWYVTNLGENGYINEINNLEGGIDAKLLKTYYRNGIWILEFDKPITKINDVQFWSSRGVPIEITDMFLPNSIEYIHNLNIGHSSIKTFHIPQNLKTLILPNGGSDFCGSLERFTGYNITEDGRAVVIDGKLMAFASFGIEEYTTPAYVTEIGEYAFTFNESLRKIVISEGVKKIGPYAFRSNVGKDSPGYSPLEYVYLPSTLECIDTYAFLYCENIKKFEGGCSFISDDGYALVVDNSCGEKWMVCYASASPITSFTIPEGTSGLENYSFYHANNLLSISFPESVKYIGATAFERTCNIGKIYGKYVYEDNRSYIVDSTLLFVADNGIKEYTTPECVNTLQERVFHSKQYLESITITDNVCYTTDWGYLFCNSNKLTTVTISANMQNLGYDPFGIKTTGYDINSFISPNIEIVYLRAFIPPNIQYNSPEKIPSLYPKMTIYVPRQSFEAYMQSSYWVPYRNYLEPYDYTDLPEPDYYISTDYTQNGKVTTLQTATKGNGIDIVLMGDAYSDRQIADGTYKTDMEYIYNNLFTEEPYKSFRDYFNVYYVTAVSATEGYEYGNTALAGYFGGGSLVGGNDNAVFNYAQKAITTDRMDEALLIVAMNSDNYAGTCYMYYPDNSTGYGNGVSVSYFPRGGDATTFAQLLHHEACGHGFAKLADEYAYEDMGAVPSDYVSQTKQQQDNWGWWKNVDFTNDLSQIRWSRFLNDSRYQYDGLGAYEGGLTYWSGVWRPTDNSIMRYNTGGFNAPSREAIYYRIHKLAYGNSWQYDYEEFVEWDARNRKAEADMSRAPYRAPANFKPTAPPVVVNKSWRDAK